MSIADLQTDSISGLAPDVLSTRKLTPPKEQILPVYLTLNAWRGIASLCVVAFHATKGVLNRHPELAAHPFYAACLWGGLGVQLFFVISGYCIVGAALSALRRSPSPLHTFTLARIRRIYPPCWFALLGAALFTLAASKMAAHGYLRSDVFTEVGFFQHPVLFYFANLTLTQFLFHQPILLDVTWSLCYEVTFYCIVALLIIPLSWAKTGRNVLNALHGLTAACLALLLFAPEHGFYPLDLWPQFGLGALVYDWLSHPQQRAPKWWAVAISIEMLLLAALDTGGLGAMHQPARAACLVSLTFAVLLLVLHGRDAQLSQLRFMEWLSAVGLFSYSLYLTHTLILRAVNQVCSLIHLTNIPVVFLMGIVIALGASRIFYQFFERPFLHKKKTNVNL